jgi:hypothetical protein
VRIKHNNTFRNLFIFLVIFAIAKSSLAAAEQTESAVPLLQGTFDKADIEVDPNVKARRQVIELFRNSPGIGYGVDVKDADRERYPESVLILGGTKYCSGVLISRTAVATAGHCMCDGVLERVFVGLDRNDTSGRYIDVSPDKGRTLLDCGEYKRSGVLPPGSRDLAVLLLKEAIPFIPRRIATQTEINTAVGNPMSNSVALVGFGKTENPELRPKQVKRYIYVPVASPNCLRQGGANSVDDVTVYGCRRGQEMVTASPRFGPGGACDGDSGAPAYIGISSGQLAIAAVVSRLVGTQCGYGSVQALLTGETMLWIQSIAPGVR